MSDNNASYMKAILYSQIAGLSAAAVVYLLTSSEGGSTDGGNPDAPVLTKEQTIKTLLKQVRAELHLSMSGEPPRSPADGLYLQEFFISFHTTLYKWRKYGQDIVGEHNFKTRIQYLKESEQAISEGATADDPTIKEQKEKYHEILKSEKTDMENYNEKLEELMFDYFNMIKKEYFMSLDKWASDPDYITKIKQQYAKIDQEMKDDEMSLPVPETLSRDVANQLLTEKEALLNNVFQQIRQMKVQHMMSGGGDKPPYDEEQTIFFNKSIFDDRMYIKYGFTGKDLQRAIIKFGLYEERLKNKQGDQSAQQQELLKIFEKFKKQQEEGKQKELEKKK